MNTREDFTDLIDTFDPDTYDTEAMRFDASNNNFSPDRAEEYQHTYIVAESIANGQFKQAREQCQRYGLNYEEQAVANGHNPWK